jgi:hypothetical protein
VLAGVGGVFARRPGRFVEWHILYHSGVPEQAP